MDETILEVNTVGSGLEVMKDEQGRVDVDEGIAGGKQGQAHRVSAGRAECREVDECRMERRVNQDNAKEPRSTWRCATRIGVLHDRAREEGARHVHHGAGERDQGVDCAGGGEPRFERGD